MSITMETDLPYLSREPDRRGNERLYARRGGKRIRIREPEGTPEFAIAFGKAVEQLGYAKVGSPSKVVLVGRQWPKNTLGWLGTQLFADHDAFGKLAKDSRRARRNSLEEMFLVAHSEDDPDPMGNCPIRFFSAQKAKRLIASDKPGAPNRRKHLSFLCSWSVEGGHIPSNPVRDIKAGTGQTKTGGGYYTWMIPDVQQFLDFHREQAQDPKTRTRSLKAILALGLLLFGGMRRQDMVTIGKQNCRGPKPNELGEHIRYIPKKTLHKRRTVSQKPLLPVLKAIIAECAEVLGDMTFLVTEYGKPFSEAGIGNWIRDRCDEAGLFHCTAHGLKKAGATIAAENGASDRQLMAMFDWDTPAMAHVYTKAAEQKRLAGDAMFLISLLPQVYRENKPLSHHEAGVVAPAKLSR